MRRITILTTLSLFLAPVAFGQVFVQVGQGTELAKSDSTALVGQNYVAAGWNFVTKSETKLGGGLKFQTSANNDDPIERVSGFGYIFLTEDEFIQAEVGLRDHLIMATIMGGTTIKELSDNVNLTGNGTLTLSEGGVLDAIASVAVVMFP